MNPANLTTSQQFELARQRQALAQFTVESIREKLSTEAGRKSLEEQLVLLKQSHLEILEAYFVAHNKFLVMTRIYKESCGDIPSFSQLEKFSKMGEILEAATPEDGLTKEN